VTFTPEVIWFTEKNDSVYVISLVWPGNDEVLVRSIKGIPVKQVRLLGSEEPILWKATDEGLRVTLPNEPVSAHGYALEILTDKQ
jgi:hypothetical protein